MLTRVRLHDFSALLLLITSFPTSHAYIKRVERSFGAPREYLEGVLEQNLMDSVNYFNGGGGGQCA